MEYFRIKYVNDGAYFLIKSDAPPVQTYNLLNIIDTVTGEDIQCRELPKLTFIDKGGTMFTSTKTLAEIPIQGFSVIDNTVTVV